MTWNKIGWFAEESSARYGATLSDGTRVTIARSMYSNEWEADFDRSYQEGKDLAASGTFTTKKSIQDYIEKYYN